MKDEWLEVLNYARKNNLVFELEPINKLLKEIITKLINSYCKGAFLDLGAGHLIYKNVALSKCKSYIGADISKINGLDVVADGHYLPFKKSSFDCVLSSAVLEHVKEPNKFVNEVSKILKKNGIFILNVPHIFYIHNEPHDYFRFTKYGASYLLEKNDFKILKVLPVGGLCSFICQLWCIVSLSKTYKFKPLFNFFFYLNKLFHKVSLKIDSFINKNERLSCGFVLVAKKI